MRYVFDMDGVLIDTRKAVEAAYAKAGMIMPAHAWGKPWQEWCPKEVHSLKQVYYPICLSLYARELPAFRVLRDLGGSVLTSASQYAAELVQEYLRYPFHLIGTGCSTVDKITALRGIKGGALYIDDDLRKGLTIMHGSGCRFVHARADKIGHYDLYDSTGKITASWTSSFWPQDVTNA